MAVRRLIRPEEAPPCGCLSVLPESPTFEAGQLAIYSEVVGSELASE